MALKNPGAPKGPGPRDTVATVIPCLRYKETTAAIGFLCRAFGFTASLVVPGDNGTIVHAQLRFGNGMIMLASLTDSGFDRFMALPDEIARRETQAPYIIVADADAHYARAKAAGAEIVLDLQDWEHGGRGYACRDLEGHLWSFGTYDPWVPA